MCVCVNRAGIKILETGVNSVMFDKLCVLARGEGWGRAPRHLLCSACAC